MRTFSMVVLLSTLAPATVASVPRARAAEPAPAARPALAIRLTPQGQLVSVIFALNYLHKADDQAKFEGVRFYTYSVPATGEVTQVGFAGRQGEARQAVLLDGRKYTYTAAMVDRQENGSLSATKLPNGEYRLRGIYSYGEQLFVVDAQLPPQEPLLLAEEPAGK